MVTMEGEYGLVCDLSDGAISNDFERILTLFLKSITPLFDAKYLTNGYRYDQVTIEGERNMFLVFKNQKT